MAGPSTSSPIFRKTRPTPRSVLGLDGDHVRTTWFRRVPCQARTHRPERARPQGRPRRPGRAMMTCGGSTRPRTMRSKRKSSRACSRNTTTRPWPRSPRGCWRSIRPRPTHRRQRCARLIDQTARVAARYGREMEVGAINVDRPRTSSGWRSWKTSCWNMPARP